MEQRPIPSDGRAYPLAASDPNARPVEIVAIAEGWRMIAVACLACAAVAAAYVLIRPPMYESRIQLLIENQSLELFRDEPSLVPAALGPSQIETQVKLIGSKGLARAVVDALDLASDPELTPHGPLGLPAPEDSDPESRERAAVAHFMKRLKVGSLGLSSVVEIGFTSRERDKAVRVVTALAQAYLDRLKESASARGEGASAWVRDRLLAAGVGASVISDAAASVAPVGLRGAILVPAGAVAGLVLGTALAILRRVLDWQARTPAAIGSAIGTELLGCLPALPTEPPAGVIAAAAASPALAQVEASIEEWRHGRGMIVGIVAADANEGVTTVVTALARRLAGHGHDVLLADANPADPAITRRYDLAGAPGLADVLRGAAYEAIEIGTDPDGFDVLPVGRIGEADPALLQLPAFAALAQRLRASYDHILVDIGPILDSAEVRASAGWIDGILFVAGAPPQRRAKLDQAMTLMGRARERLLGVVVNRTAR